MEIPLQPLLVIEDEIDGIPAALEIRQEVGDNETLTHVTVIQEGKEHHRYDMRWKACNDQEEPQWQFIGPVPGALKELEWNISEALVEKDR